MVATIAGVSAVLVGLMFAFPADERLVFALGGPCCVIELYLFIKRRRTTHYAFYAWAWLVMTIATAVWWLDLTKRVCDPRNHFVNGHAVWHLLSALTFFLLYKFYAQFAVFDAGPGHRCGASAWL
jgi:hypothetical protein